MISYSNTKERAYFLEPFYKPYFEEIFSSGIYFNGKYQDLLTNELARYKGYEHVILCSSGTAALFILASYYRKTCDTVLTTPITYKATYNAFKRAGFRLQLGTVDNRKLGQFLKPTRAVVVAVGLFGAHPILNPRNLNIEDACQDWITNTNEYTKAISFDPTKNIASCGNGGAILTNNVSIADYARKFICNHQGVSGLNLRMSELECAYVYAQFPFIDAWQDARARIAKLYDKIFSSSLCTTYESHDYQKYVIHKDELDLAKLLGLETKQMYPGNPNIDAYYALPIYPEMEEALKETITSALDETA